MMALVVLTKRMVNPNRPIDPATVKIIDKYSVPVNKGHNNQCLWWAAN